jgi:hypothetical protein
MCIAGHEVDQAGVDELGGSLPGSPAEVSSHAHRGNLKQSTHISQAMHQISVVDQQRNELGVSQDWAPPKQQNLVNKVFGTGSDSGS